VDVLRGRKYLLFVDRGAKKGWWTADGCGNSGEASKAVFPMKTQNAELDASVAIGKTFPNCTNVAAASLQDTSDRSRYAVLASRRPSLGSTSDAIQNGKAEF
jgi:hypothetical protein